MSDPVPAPPTRPRWVKVLVIVAVLVVGLVIVIAIASGGEHGPGRHLPGGDGSGDHTPPVEHSP
jgi:hypothetical protein